MIAAILRAGALALAATLAVTGGASSAVAAPQSGAAPWTGLPQVALGTPIVTRHSGTFHGHQIGYEARVEPFVVTDGAGRPAARLVAISYTADRPASNRPVLFAFNGGPISPSILVHMGLLGPRRVAVPDDIGNVAGIRLVDNTYANLDIADLVLFDPAETGFSRALPGIDFTRSFTSVPDDARELSGLVQAWLKAHGREGAPVYLVGESYGTIRAAEAARQLVAAGIVPAGVILVGQAVNILEYSQRPDNIVSYAVSLPTLAAIGWAHGKAERNGRSFDRFIDDATRFGQEEYLPTLFLGQRAPLARRAAVARKLQEFTGLPADFYLQHDLKVSKLLYQRSLLPGRFLAVNDARYVGAASGGDPLAPTLQAFTALFAAYLRDELHVAGPDRYNDENPFKGGLNDWNWGPNRSPFGDWFYRDAFTALFKADPRFRLMIGDGYYDTQTTIGAQDYLVANSAWPIDRVRSFHYQGGHMAYTVEASARAMNEDIRRMIESGQW